MTIATTASHCRVAFIFLNLRERGLTYKRDSRPRQRQNSNRPAFWALLTEVPHLSYKILVTLSRRVRQAEKSPLA